MYSIESKMAAVMSVMMIAAAAQVDPKAPCPYTTPRDASCCYNHTLAPVLGGVDFVDLAGRKQGRDSPVFGNQQFAAKLNGLPCLRIPLHDCWGAPPVSAPGPASRTRTLASKQQ